MLACTTCLRRPRGADLALIGQRRDHLRRHEGHRRHVHAGRASPGIVLTIGMAVDANVLIYERIREEIFDGEDTTCAARSGRATRKALSTILDANITNLIVCFVLFRTATTESEGLRPDADDRHLRDAVHGAVRDAADLLPLHRFLQDSSRCRCFPPIVPAIHRALEPSDRLDRPAQDLLDVSINRRPRIRDPRLRSRGVDMFDTEFRGGVSLTMLTAPSSMTTATDEPDLTRRRPAGSSARCCYHTGERWRGGRARSGGSGATPRPISRQAATARTTTDRVAGCCVLQRAPERGDPDRRHAGEVLRRAVSTRPPRRSR